MRHYLFTLLLVSILVSAQTKTFTNPLLPQGPDPYTTYHDGYYYYTHTVGDKLVLWKTKNIATLSLAESKTIWTPPLGTNYSKNIWSPELHFINNKWYAYFSADDGDTNNHRMYVLENESTDPMLGNWLFRGKLTVGADTWASDPNVFNYKGKLYITWSGWAGEKNRQQNIYIAKMINPWTLEGNRVLLSEPFYNWERQGDSYYTDGFSAAFVNEAPQFLQHNDDLFIIYSASGCWTDNYCLGLLRFEGNDLLQPHLWSKHPLPVFSKSIANSVFAPGHSTFFTSSNGLENWILYHANDKEGQGCGNLRSPRIQKFEWDEYGMPVFSVPISRNTIMKMPR